MEEFIIDFILFKEPRENRGAFQSFNFNNINFICDKFLPNFKNISFSNIFRNNLSISLNIFSHGPSHKRTVLLNTQSFEYLLQFLLVALGHIWITRSYHESCAYPWRVRILFVRHCRNQGKNISFVETLINNLLLKSKPSQILRMDSTAFSLTDGWSNEARILRGGIRIWDSS